MRFMKKIKTRPIQVLLQRKRAIMGLGLLASLFVAMALISSATGHAGKAGAVSLEGISGTGTESAESPAAESPAEVANPGMGSMMVKVIVTVLLLIGILYGGMRALRALSGRVGGGAFRPGAISVLHKTHIAPKKAIYVVKVGGKAMVVGVTDSQINHLSDLDNEELASLGEPEKSRAKGFKEHLLGFATGGKERA